MKTGRRLTLRDTIQLDPPSARRKILVSGVNPGQGQRSAGRAAAAATSAGHTGYPLPDFEISIMQDEAEPPEQSLNKVTLMQYNGILTDFKIVCKGEIFYCHKLIMATASNYLKQMFHENQMTGMFTVIMNCVTPEDVRNILKYVYSGNVRVRRGEETKNFLKAGELLHIDTLAPPEKSTPKSKSTMGKSSVLGNENVTKDAIGVKTNESPIKPLRKSGMPWNFNESGVQILQTPGMRSRSRLLETPANVRENGVMNFMSSTKIHHDPAPIVPVKKIPQPRFEEPSAPSLSRDASKEGSWAKTHWKESLKSKSGSPLSRLLEEEKLVKRHVDVLHPRLLQKGIACMREFTPSTSNSSKRLSITMSSASSASANESKPKKKPEPQMESMTPDAVSWDPSVLRRVLSEHVVKFPERKNKYGNSPTDSEAKARRTPPPSPSPCTRTATGTAKNALREINTNTTDANKSFSTQQKYKAQSSGCGSSSRDDDHTLQKRNPVKNLDEHEQQKRGRKHGLSKEN